MNAMIVSSAPDDLQRQQRAEARRRQRGDDRERMREALVEHAEHQIDRDQRGEDEQRLRAGRLRERLRLAGELRLDDVGHAHVEHRLLNGGGRVLEHLALAQPERDGDGRKLALMIDHQRRDASARSAPRSRAASARRRARCT